MLYLYREFVKLRLVNKCFKGFGFKVVYVDILIFVYIRLEGYCKFFIVINFGYESWIGVLNGISGLGIVEIDSEMKMKGISI